VSLAKPSSMKRPTVADVREALEPGWGQADTAEDEVGASAGQRLASTPGCDLADPATRRCRSPRRRRMARATSSRSRGPPTTIARVAPASLADAEGQQSDRPAALNHDRLAQLRRRPAHGGHRHARAQDNTATLGEADIFSMKVVVEHENVGPSCGPGLAGSATTWGIRLHRATGSWPAGLVRPSATNAARSSSRGGCRNPAPGCWNRSVVASPKYLYDRPARDDLHAEDCSASRALPCLSDPLGVR